MMPIYHMFLFAISPKDSALLRQALARPSDAAQLRDRVRPAAPLPQPFLAAVVEFAVIAVTSALTLFVATCAAFAISRLKVRGGRTVMNLALFTYFIPAAFLAVPMYKTMGNYGLLNNQWALILAMVTIASPYCDLGAQAGVRQAAVRARRGREDGRRLAAAAVPPGLPAADGAVAGRGRHLRAAAGLERVPLRLPAAVERHRRHAGVALGNFLAADDSPWELLMTTGLIYALPPAAIYYTFKRYMVGGLTAGAVKSGTGRPRQRRPRR
jgi:multiple sugar transport system permease protein